MISCKIFYIVLYMVVVYISKNYGKELNMKNRYTDIEIKNENSIKECNYDISNAVLEADENLCGNHSTKTEFINGLKVCTCEDGYVPGINEVCTEICNESKICENGGTCHNGICTCPPRTRGTFCEKIHVTCWNSYLYEEYAKVRGLYCCCKSDAPAKCKYDVKKLNAYCECPKKGEVYEDKSNACKECNCGKHGKCVYDDAGKKLTCECSTGYSENSMGICQYCYCGDNSICALNVDGTKNCSCPSGYRDVNGFCTDINECEEGIATCLSSEVCKNIPGGAFCACADGYRHTDNGCEDIDECAFEKPCRNKGTQCVNMPGSYECRCEAGYLARGGHKSDLECQKNSAAGVGYGLLATLFTVIVIGLSIIVYMKYRR
ncbi:fibropellin-1 [Parasteatoda tepidariorum]|uniref:fibropellin-1 n=1 Tax=Parasteatoda tepidariorum TaxID=114398 RepID=UPI0039BCFD64